jgi:hypothetical protein
MAANKTLLVFAEGGWVGVTHHQEYPLTTETSFEFDVPDSIPPAHEISHIMDAERFYVEVVYKNSTGSRQEKFGLTPQRVTTCTLNNKFKN